MPKPRYHAAVSLALALLVVRRSHRWRDALPILVAGVLVDLDHLVDLIANRLAGDDARFLIMPLHAWEWVAGLLLRDRLGLAGGLAAHLALDQINRAVRHPFFYCITVRAAHLFRAQLPLADPAVLRTSARWMRQSPLDWF